MPINYGQYSLKNVPEVIPMKKNNNLRSPEKK